MTLRDDWLESDDPAHRVPRTDEGKARAVLAALHGQEWMHCCGCGKECVEPGDPEHRVIVWRNVTEQWYRPSECYRTGWTGLKDGYSLPL